MEPQALRLLAWAQILAGSPRPGAPCAAAAEPQLAGVLRKNPEPAGRLPLVFQELPLQRVLFSWEPPPPLFEVFLILRLRQSLQILHSRLAGGFPRPVFPEESPREPLGGPR